MDGIWSYRRYQIDVPQSLWPDFFEQLTHDHRGQLITLNQFPPASPVVHVLSHNPLQSITYQTPSPSSNLVITVSSPPNLDHDATYTYPLGHPQVVRITTDEAGELLACIVLDRSQTQTVIGFHPLVGNKKREPKPPLSAV
jgi:hypothetical protein